MTSIFDENGVAIPCTVVEAGPCYVTQIRTKVKDGYNAVQLGFDEKPERLLTKPIQGHLAQAKVKGLRLMQEFKNFSIDSLTLGAEVKVDLFTKGDKVSVTAKSKGRGFQGVVKRHHFHGVGMTSHGASDRVRAPGSIGASSYPSRVFKGQRMAGRMGYRNVTVKNLTVLQVIPESNLILIKGSIPGAINTYVTITK
jgi:large subunit ribosomal protein L3